MADNIKVTQGAGADPDVATNDKSGRHVQIVQLDLGGDTTVAELTGGQKTMASSLPVAIASDQSALSVVLGVGSNNIGDVDVLTVRVPLSTVRDGTAATEVRESATTCSSVNRAALSGAMFAPPVITAPRSSTDGRIPVSFAGVLRRASSLIARTCRASIDLLTAAVR